MKKFLLLPLAVLVFAAGCMRDAPTQAPAEVSSGPLLIQAPAEEVAEYVLLLDDIAERLLPSLVDQEIAASLDADIRDLASALTAGDTDAAREALGSATAVLASYQATHGWSAPDAADLDGISLNLMVADTLIGTDED